MERFEQVIQNMIRFFDEFKEIEQKKLEAVQKERITFLEDSMNKEQAYILKLRGLEQEREQAQKQCGWERKTFREILQLVSEEEKQHLEPLFLTLSKKIKEFQTINEDVNTLMKIKLHKINTVLENNGASYTHNGNIESRKTTFTSKKV